MNKGFGSDNHSGVHPLIMEALVEANHDHAPSYGTDAITKETEKLFKKLMGPKAQVHFVFNGTAANVLCLSSLMGSHQSVICSEMSHLNLDECGAPEKFIGCKVVTLPTENGKITPEQIKTKLIRGGDQHFSQPKVVSITQPTEVGTMYSFSELQELREFTQQHQLKLHIDGARFLYAPLYLQKSILELTGELGIDALSFGGTKNGLMFGEACVLFDDEAKDQFRFIRKQAMQLPSKTRFVAAQFHRLLQGPGLWREIAEHGHKMACYLEERLRETPEIQAVQKVQANSVFVTIPKDWTKPLREQSFFYVWDEAAWVMRWMVSFDTQKDDIDSFIETITTLRGN